MSEGWQQDVAIVLAAHGDRAGGAPNATLLGHRQRVSEAGQFPCVTAGVLKGEPSLEDALALAIRSGTRRIAVYPFFMAEGYFVRTVLAPRVAAAAADSPGIVSILPPLGLDPNLPRLVHDEALAAARLNGFAADGARLLLVGHGSKLGPASADATRAAAKRVAELGAFAEVATAFLEEPPFLADALGALATPLPIIVAGFFSGDGLHAGEDVPLAIRESGTTAVYAGSIGRSGAVPALIAAAVEAAMRNG